MFVSRKPSSLLLDLYFRTFYQDDEKLILTVLMPDQKFGAPWYACARGQNRFEIQPAHPHYETEQGTWLQLCEMKEPRRLEFDLVSMPKKILQYRLKLNRYAHRNDVRAYPIPFGRSDPLEAAQAQLILGKTTNKTAVLGESRMPLLRHRLKKL